MANALILVFRTPLGPEFSPSLNIELFLFFRSKGKKSFDSTNVFLRSDRLTSLSSKQKGLGRRIWSQKVSPVPVAVFVKTGIQEWQGCPTLLASLVVFDKNNTAIFIDLCSQKLFHGHSCRNMAPGSCTKDDEQCY